MLSTRQLQFVSATAIVLFLLAMMISAWTHQSPTINFTAVSDWIQQWLASNSDYPDLAGSLKQGGHTERTAMGTLISAKTWSGSQGCNTFFQLEIGFVEIQFPSFKPGSEPCTSEDVRNYWEEFKQYLRSFADNKLSAGDMPQVEAAINQMDPYIQSLPSASP